MKLELKFRRGEDHSCGGDGGEPEPRAHMAKPESQDTAVAMGRIGMQFDQG